MCQSDVYTIEEGQEELVLENVALLRVDGDQVAMRTLFGEPLSLAARIKEIDLLRNRILLEKPLNPG